MEDNILDVISQIKVIKSKSGIKKYPESLKQKILDLYLGATRRKALAKRLGVGMSTITAWRRSKAPITPQDNRTENFRSISISNKISNSPRLMLHNRYAVWVS